MSAGVSERREGKGRVQKPRRKLAAAACTPGRVLSPITAVLSPAAEAGGCPLLLRLGQAGGMVGGIFSPTGLSFCHCVESDFFGPVLHW